MTPETKARKIVEFIGEKATYDNDSQMIFGCKGKAMQLILDVRGWGAIQNLFKRNDETIDFEAAYKFQDELGEWIADSINQKLQVKAEIEKKN